MKKFQFLCVNHRGWLNSNPDAAIYTWHQSYSRCLDLADECNYAEAINHAGAAFETAEIVLEQQTPVTSVAIRRFADSGMLLIQLLHAGGEKQFAGAVLAASIARFEQLLVLGVERKAVLAGCQRFLEIDDHPGTTGRNNVAHARMTATSQRIH